MTFHRSISVPQNASKLHQNFIKMHQMHRSRHSGRVGGSYYMRSTAEIAIDDIQITLKHTANATRCENQLFTPRGNNMPTAYRSVLLFQFHTYNCSLGFRCYSCLRHNARKSHTSHVLSARCGDGTACIVFAKVELLSPQVRGGQHTSEPSSAFCSFQIRDARAVWEFNATHAYGIACHMHLKFNSSSAGVITIHQFPPSNRATSIQIMNFRVRKLPKNIKISKSFLPQAKLPGLVAFQKLGSRMDAPIFVFDGVCQISPSWIWF